MTINEYVSYHYPHDFIKIADEVFVLPKGGAVTCEQKEITSTFTTADGSVRKDCIKKYESVSVKFSVLQQKDFDNILEIIQKIEQADYEIKKHIFLKTETMPSFATAENVFSFFSRIEIQTVGNIKAMHTFRKNGMFLYSGVVLKIN